MATATLTSKGQVTIPASVRASLGLGTGDRIEFIELGKGQFAVITATQSVKSLKGMIKKTTRPITIEEMNTVIASSGANSA